jgi:hypothetical protein
MPMLGHQPSFGLGLANRINTRRLRSSPLPRAADVVKRQVEIGLDCIGDGEYRSALYIRWFGQQMLGTQPLKPGEVGMREWTRERDVFRTLYAEIDRVGTRLHTGRAATPADLRVHYR